MVSVTEQDGRIYVRISGPRRQILEGALCGAFAGHRRIYFSALRGEYRLWARDREHLAVWLETWLRREQWTWDAGPVGAKN